MKSRALLLFGVIIAILAAATFYLNLPAFDRNAPEGSLRLYACQQTPDVVVLDPARVAQTYPDVANRLDRWNGTGEIYMRYQGDARAFYEDLDSFEIQYDHIHACIDLDIQ